MSTDVVVKEEFQEFYRILLENNISKEEAVRFCLYKQENQEKIQTVSGVISVRSQVPLAVLDNLDVCKRAGSFIGLKEPIKNDLLWRLGINTRKYPYILDIGFYVYNGKKYLGEFIFGQERLDKEWLKLSVEGRRISSIDSQLFAKRDWSLTKEIKKLSNRS